MFHREDGRTTDTWTLRTHHDRQALLFEFSEMFEESPNAYTQAPPDEQQLVTDYRSFNDEGKEKVREYVADLKGNPRYKKRDEPAVDQQA